MNTTSKLLEISNLYVSFDKGNKEIEAVKGITLNVERGEAVGIVGESGSGKSVTALSILKLLPYPYAWHKDGSIKFKDNDLLNASDKTIRAIRGDKIAMIFQEPMTSLNPLRSIEKQISEVLEIHKGIKGKEARKRVLELLEKVGLNEAESRLKALPHELSGGQRQRVMIAMALAGEPELLIADEPTTALDVTIQAQIIELLLKLKEEMNMALILITHDLSLVKKATTKLYLMKNGKIVETGKTKDVLTNPRHEYTKRLIASVPKGEPLNVSLDSELLLKTDKLNVHFPLKKNFWGKPLSYIKAVNDIDLNLKQGTTLGLVGESGSGKTTLGLALMRLISSKGTVVFNSSNLSNLGFKKLKPFRKDMQIVFQDPFGSLSPRMSIGDIVTEGLAVHKIGLNHQERLKIAANVLEEVGLDKSALNRYPHEFSGGQRQRISMARALILKPKLIIFDEPTSALDVSIQAQIIDLLKTLQNKYNLTYIFISHDLKVVKALAHEIAIMKDGKIIEFGTSFEVFKNPKNDYTKNLIASAFDFV
ncbi:MAG: ABC transporter ATP-binding protein [Alphaproteobacteria bacterium]